MSVPELLEPLFGGTSSMKMDHFSATINWYFKKF